MNIVHSSFLKLKALVVLPTLYIFLDEGGNLDFSSKGTKYFTLTCISLHRPFKLHSELDAFKYDLIEFRKPPRIDLESFHCCDDNRHVREHLFNLFSKNLPANSVDSVIVEKSKTGPALQAPDQFYPRLLGYLLRYAIENAPSGIGELVIITDTIPVKKDRKTIEKAIKQNLRQTLPENTPFRLMHHNSKAHYGLQIVDYLNWAIYRKWDKDDPKHYNEIKALIRSEFDIFMTGDRHYY